MVTRAKCNVSMGGCGAEVRKFKRCRIEAAISLPQLNEQVHGSCPKLERTLERSGQRAGVKARNVDGNFAC
jgi:hypothetical protein